RAELLAEALEGAGLALAELAGAGAREHGPAEERRGLAGDDLEVLAPASPQAASPGELERLGDHHLLDHLEHPVDDAGDTGGLDAAEGVDQQPVAAEDRGRVAVDDPGRLR